MADSIVRLEGTRFHWASHPGWGLEIPRFELAEGERVFLHGPSGSGKSTLLGLLCGVLRPERGSVLVLGKDLARLDSAERDRFRVDHIGIIFQQFNLVSYLSVMENVLLPCRFSARRRRRAEVDGATVVAEAGRLLDALDMDPSLQARPVTELSVGQQQRVAAARAFLGRPELVVADEPTSSLDAGRQAAFVELLLSESRKTGTSLLLVSHDLGLASAFTRMVDMSSFSPPMPAGVDR